MVITNNGAMSKMFTYEECNVMAILDKEGNYWYKAKDIATILEYGNTKDAIIRHIDDEYKKSFADMIVGIPDHQNLHPKTVFIDDSGFFQLVSRSKKPTAIKLWRQITKEILPTLFRTGYYEMPITDSDIDRVTKSFYDDNMLSEFMGNPCVYFAYVGKHKIIKNGITKLLDVFKYGNSIEISRRDLDEHRKYYEIFNILGIWKSLGHISVEKKIEKNFKSLNMVVKLKIKGKNKKSEENKDEHIVLSQRHGVDYCLKMIQQVVNGTSLPQEDEYKNKIKDLEHQLELSSQKNKYLMRLNRQLKNNIIDLRKRNQ